MEASIDDGHCPTALDCDSPPSSRPVRLPSVAAGLVRGGRLVWAEAVGTLDGRAGGAPATTTTQYRIGSITKTFVGVEVLRLRDEGRLDLSDPLAAVLPETAAAGFGHVTIAQLLSHSSGLQAETDGPWWERTPGGDWEALLASRPQLRFRPRCAVPLLQRRVCRARRGRARGCAASRGSMPSATACC